MALTPYDFQAQIVAEVGDPNGTVFPLMETLWNMAASTRSGNELIALYVKRAAIDVRMAEEAPNTDFKAGQLQVNASQTWQHLQQMRADVQAELLRIEAKVAATRVPTFGVLTRTAPTTPPTTDSPDRNDSLYTGDPYQQISRLTN